MLLYETALEMIRVLKEPNVRERDCCQVGLLKYLVSDWKWLFTGGLFSFGLANLLLLGWPAGLSPSIRLPYVFAGDGLLVQWLIQRSIEGWVFINTRSGFPFGSYLYDYPNSDAGSFLIFKILGVLTNSCFSAFDLYVLLSFPVVFAVTFIVLRSFEIRKVYCAMAAILFAFAPFHFSRLFYGHVLYLWYFGIPLFFYYGKNIFSYGKSHWNLRNPVRLVSFVFVSAALSSFGVYYAFFGTIVLMVCGAAATVRAGKFRPVISSLLLCAAIFSGVVLNLLPNIIYRGTHSVNPEVAVRSPIESEIYGLKIMHLLLPQPGHRIDALKSYTEKYNSTFPLSNTTSSLGVVGVIGFVSVLLSIGTALVGRKVSPCLGFVSVVVITLLLISTVGGFNVIFATLVTPVIRGWDRISIFILFGSLLAISLLMNGCKSINTNSRRSTLVAALVAFVGLLDQTPDSYFPIVANAFASAPVDERFIQEIESLMPPRSAVYQLPYVAFPESGPTHELGVYQLGSGFFNSKALRWSFGGMQGRDGDLFYRALSKETEKKQLEVIKRLGFTGVYIDRRGYTDRGERLIEEFTRLLGHAPSLERPDGNVAFFMIEGDSSVITEEVQDVSQVMARAGYYADKFGVRSDATFAQGIDFSSSANLPYFVSDLSGLSVAEPGGRWSDANLSKSVIISFRDPLPDRFTIEVGGAPFGPNIGKSLEMTIGSVRIPIEMLGSFNVKIPIDLKGEKVHTIELVPPLPTSPKELGMAGADARKLGVALRSIKID